MTDRPANDPIKARDRLRALWAGIRSRVFRASGLAPLLLPPTFILALILGSGPLLDRIDIRLLFTILESGPLALLASGAALVLSTGGVDLSSAGVATLGGVSLLVDRK